MFSTTCSRGIHAFSAVSPYHTSAVHGSDVPAGAHPNYDSSSFSTVTDSHDRFQLELVSRLSREVRTATTTGRIQELHRAVSSGEYHPDPAAIARCIMLRLG